ncbi:tail fiber protein [Enterobacter phage N5822]|nr:tail fiber protein [Enterobacter phage N5822]
MHLPNGSQIFIEASRGSELSASAITNAEKPVFTMSDTDDLAKGDYVIVTESTGANCWIASCVLVRYQVE